MADRLDERVRKDVDIDADSYMHVFKAQCLFYLSPSSSVYKLGSPHPYYPERQLLAQG